MIRFVRCFQCQVSDYRIYEFTLWTSGEQLAAPPGRRRVS
jgi:hypothetical protein